MTVAFMAPSTAPTKQVLLRSPDFQDALTPDNRVQVSTAMDGTIRTRIAKITTKLSITFSNLTRTKAIEVRDFLVFALGEKVRYVDQDGASWVGYFLTVPFEVTTDGTGGGASGIRRESNRLVLEFEGSKIT